MTDHTQAADGQTHRKPPESFIVRVLRQDGPGHSAYWQRFRVKHEPDMNMTSVLQRIAAMSETADGEKTTPVAYDSNCLEEVCGACTMLINGRVRQACSALVDQLLAEDPSEITLQPAAKFPVVRDLWVDRSRLFRALEKVKGWVPVDGYYEMGPGPRQSQHEQEEMYPLSKCMSCGCCLEACPQYVKVEVARRDDETDEQYEARRDAEYDRAFMGAHAISQAMLFNMHPTGKNIADERLDAMSDEGGVHICGNSQNCVAVCPKEIPLTRSIGRAGRAVTVHSIKKWFGN